MKNTTYSGQTAERRRVRDDGVRRTLLTMALGALLGFLLPWATVYGEAAPFGVGLAAAAYGPSAVPIFLAAVAGYVMQGMAVSLRYVAALVAVVGIRWTISGFPSITRGRLFPSVAAFLGTLITGGALVFTADPTAASAVSILAESLLAGGFAYLVAAAREPLDEGLTAENAIALGAVPAVAMSVLMTVEFGGIAPARIVSLWLLLLGARVGGTAVGAGLGAVFGTALALSSPTRMPIALAYALGGCLAGTLGARRRVFAVLAATLASVAIVASAGEAVDVVVVAYESLAAGVLFLVTPPRVEHAAERILCHDRYLPEVQAVRRAAALKMHHAADAVAEVARTVDSVSAQLSGLGSPDLGSMYETAAEDVCRTCRRKMYCHTERYAETMEIFAGLTPLLRERETVTDEDIGGHLKAACPRRKELATRITAAYREFLVRESAFRRLGELRRVVTDQFSATAHLLDDFADSLTLDERTDESTADRIRAALDEQHIRTKQVVCRISERGHMCVELLLDGHYHTKNREAFRRRISDLCGRSFAFPVVERLGEETRIAFTERCGYRVAVGTAQLRSDGETLCGDAFECFRDGCGRQLAVLSDGMGSGGRAAVDGAMAAGLSSRLLKAGFGFESLLRLVNTALMAKSEDESLATLDIAAIDLFTGELELLKAGAGVSLLYSRGRVSRLDESSLPLGILRELTFARTTLRLTDGDILVMMSDGVSDNGIEWVEELLRDYDRDAGGMQGLAELIADTSHDRLGREKSDDVTVIALGVYRTK